VAADVTQPTLDAREGDADQWVAGGTLPDLDETWGIPADDPDATVPLRR
jgi:hypothetical protein